MSDVRNIRVGMTSHFVLFRDDFDVVFNFAFGNSTDAQLSKGQSTGGDIGIRKNFRTPSRPAFDSHNLGSKSEHEHKGKDE